MTRSPRFCRQSPQEPERAPDVVPPATGDDTKSSRGFMVKDRVSGSFGNGIIRHIHGRKATVEYGFGQKLQVKLCHLKRLDVVQPTDQQDTKSSRGFQEDHRSDDQTFKAGPHAELINPWKLTAEEYDHWHKSTPPAQRELILVAARAEYKSSRGLEVDSGEELELPLDAPNRNHLALQRSLSGESCTCPSCQQSLISLDDGCGVCGWTKSQFLEDKPYGAEISSRKSSTSNDFLEDKCEPEISSGKTRRRKGDGSGCIYWRTNTKSGKDYHEAYYQYEFWSEGDRLIKSTKYIPKRLLKQVQQLDAEKGPVREILRLLKVEI